MHEIFSIKSYISVGPFLFGMNKQEVEALFSKEPDRVKKGFTGKLGMYWDNIVIKYNEFEQVDEISFVSGGEYNVSYCEIDLFQDPSAKEKLDLIELPKNVVGYDVYFSIGIAITGFTANDTSKTVTVFDKSLIPIWEK